MKKTKICISFVLVIVMMLSCCYTAFAAESTVADCPVIEIRGIATGNIYADRDDTSTLMGVPTRERIEEIFKEDIVPSLLIYSATHDADMLAEDICAVLNEEFEDWFNNTDGTAKGNSGVIMTYPSSVKETSRLTFSYDWRGDPIEIAAQLKDFINYVTEKSGCEKVAVACHSLGSVVLVSYFSLYGNDKVKAVVFDTPAVMGLQSIGDALSGKLDFDGESLTYFLKAILGEAEYGELIASLSDIFELAGIPGMLSVFFDNIIEKVGPVVYRETLIPLFGCWLSIWSMVPDEQIDESMGYVFNNLCKDEDYSALRAKIEFYNSEVRGNKRETLLDFDSQGKVAVISRYGLAAVPVSGSWSLVSDSVIETSSSSLGATTAKVGEYFSEEYLEGKDIKYISPDRTVDASTCLFPEKTWFIKNAQHSEDEATRGLYNTFLFSAQELTADTSELSRFTYYDRENGALIEDTTEPERTEELSAMQRLFNFLKAFFRSIGDFFKKMFSK